MTGRTNSEKPNETAAPRSKVAVIGGGIAGLSAAHYLLNAGCSVELFEASEHFGGLGASFPLEGREIEQFYHCMLPTDDALLGLMRDIGFSTEVRWHETSFAVWDGAKYYPLNGAADLLKFTALPLFDRLRLGLTGLWGRLVSSSGLDDITAQQWLTRLSGRRAFDLFWKTLLQAKFGDRFGGVPALWFWTRFNREKGQNKEAKGLPPGGYRALTDALVSSLRRRGAQLYSGIPIQSIDVDAAGRIVVESSAGRSDFDKLLITVALPLVRKLIKPGSALEAQMGQIDFSIDYQAVINVLLVAKKSFSPHYWVASIDPSLPFQGIVETSKIFPPDRIGGKTLLYLMRYLDRGDSLYSEEPAQLKEQFLAAFLGAFKNFSPSDIEDVFVFKTPFVEPAYTPSYLKRRPPAELLEAKIFLATTAQVYPNVTSWNGSVGLAREVAALAAAAGGS